MSEKTKPPDVSVGRDGIQGLQKNVAGTLLMQKNCADCQADFRECSLRSAVKSALVNAFLRGKLPPCVVCKINRRHGLEDC